MLFKAVGIQLSFIGKPKAKFLCHQCYIKWYSVNCIHWQDTLVWCLEKERIPINEKMSVFSIGIGNRYWWHECLLNRSGCIIIVYGQVHYTEGHPIHKDYNPVSVLGASMTYHMAAA